MFHRHKQANAPASTSIDFSYLAADDLYFDAACQTLRPNVVIDAVNAYYKDYNACGGRVRYAWGQRVDATVERARAHFLSYLNLPSHDYVTVFGLNTTMGINLLLQQVPTGRFRRVVTTHKEHNSVFLPSITTARRLNIPRTVLSRTGNIVQYETDDLADALIILGAVSNFDGAPIENLRELVDDAHRVGGVVIVDAAQALAHHRDVVSALPADAIVGSAHKMYAPTLGVMAVTKDLIASLAPTFLGGGTVADVTEHDFTLDTQHPWTILEPGLQNWAGIVGFETALTWLERQDVAATIQQRSAHFWARLSEVPQLTPLNTAPSAVVSVIPEILDAHTIATFFSKTGIMVRSGYFCAHHELKERLALPPLLRFSLSLSVTPQAIDQAFDAITPMLKGLA